MIVDEELTERIIGCAIEVHRHLGPGLLESVYEQCLCLELQASNISHERQPAFPVSYKGKNLESFYRLDIAVEDRVILELKSVEKILPIHEAQLLTYLKLTRMKVGLLINFNVTKLTSGIVRRVL